MYLNAKEMTNETALFGSVINVSKNDTLNVRFEPNYKAKKVGEIPSKWRVGIEKCKGINNSTWCRVYPLVQVWHENFCEDKNIGWVNAKYLKFSNRGYVIVKGKRNCAYSLSCLDGKCKVVNDFEENSVIDYKKTGLNEKWVKRGYLKGESNFGVTPDGVDGYCNNGIYIDAYLKNKK